MLWGELLLLPALAWHLLPSKMEEYATRLLVKFVWLGLGRVCGTTTYAPSYPTPLQSPPRSFFSFTTLFHQK